MQTKGERLQGNVEDEPQSHRQVVSQGMLEPLKELGIFLTAEKPMAAFNPSGPGAQLAASKASIVQARNRVLANPPITALRCRVAPEMCGVPKIARDGKGVARLRLIMIDHLKNVTETTEVERYLLRLRPKDEEEYTHGIRAYGRARNWRKALSLFKEMQEKGVKASLLSCRALIAAFELCGQWNQVLSMLDFMSMQGLTEEQPANGVGPQHVQGPSSSPVQDTKSKPAQHVSAPPATGTSPPQASTADSTSGQKPELSALVLEARRLLEVRRNLGETLARIQAKAQTAAKQIRTQADDIQKKAAFEKYPTLNTAPPDIRQKLEASFGGTYKYPLVSEVEDMWRTMAAAPKAPFGDWSGKGLRTLAAAAFKTDVLNTGSLKDEGAEGAFAAEVLQRRAAVELSLRGGMPVDGNALNEANLERAPTFKETMLERTGHRVEAYVTHLTDDDYVLGASVLATSLAATQTTRPLVAMVTDGVSAAGRKILEDSGWLLVDVGLVGVANQDSVHVRGYFSKIYLWGLPFHSLIYIDTDVIVTENLDHLFTGAEGQELAACTDSLPHMDDRTEVQAGLMVVEPSSTRFKDLWEIVCGSRRPATGLDDYKHYEQGFLTSYFDGDRGAEAASGGGPRPRWKLLDAKYNFNVRYLLRPLYDGLHPGTTATVHFACCKPWDDRQRHFAPPAYLQMFYEFVRAVGIPWRAGEVAMDTEREKFQKKKFEEWIATKGDPETIAALQAHTR